MWLYNKVLWSIVWLDSVWQLDLNKTNFINSYILRNKLNHENTYRISNYSQLLIYHMFGHAMATTLNHVKNVKISVTVSCFTFKFQRKKIIIFFPLCLSSKHGINGFNLYVLIKKVKKIIVYHYHQQIKNQWYISFHFVKISYSHIIIRYETNLSKLNDH